MLPPTQRSQPPLVGPTSCRVLALAFLLLALFAFAPAQIVDQPGWFGSLAMVLALIAPVSAVVALAVLPRLPAAYRAPLLSAACLTAWFFATWLASLAA